MMKTITAIAFVALTSVLIFAGFHKPETPNPTSASATYSHGVLHVVLPFDSATAGVSDVSADVLDPEDQSLAGSKERISVVSGRQVWTADLKLKEELPLEDLVWQRLHYRIRSASGETTEATEPLSRLLLIPIVHVMGQNNYLAGGRAAEKIIVTNSTNEPLIANGKVHIELLAPKHDRQFLFDGHLNGKGSADVQFALPNWTGAASLHYVVETAAGASEFTQNVKLEDKVSVLLTTEKPVYQPGQTIHIRALALNRLAHEPVSQRALTFELEDSRGNKVFRKATQTDNYGVASTEFSLADEVNLGAYHLRALLGDNTQELTVNVDRYVLPKFKVAVEVAKAKHGFRPGDHVTGTVHADYFFGKPVSRAEVSIKASAMDVDVFEAGKAEGTADDEGAYHFDIKLPDYFAGRPLTQGTARVLFEATVKDSASHSETRGEPVTVSQSPLLITAVPEGGTLVPGLENQVFLLSSYPDGSPAKTTINTDQGTVKTDAHGVAVITVSPHDGQTDLKLTARDEEGNRASTTIPLDARSGDEQVLLRPDRAIYKAGDHMSWKVFSTKKSGTVYVDIVKDGQTVLTRDVDLANGQAELSMTASPELTGTIECNAYLFGRDAQPVADHRLVFVQPANELHVETSLDAPVYKPGGEARISFHVTNDHGQGVQAALGLQIVDQAVFALAEKQPGFAKVFFYLEQEVMKPRYEIHSFDWPEAITSAEPTQAARALFSATEIVRNNRFTGEFNRNLEQAKFGEYRNRYSAALTTQATKALAISHHPNLRDAWGNDVHIDEQGVYSLISSPGPDGRFNTADDLRVYVVAPKIRIEHDRGPFNGQAEIDGTVTDLGGGSVNGASVTVREKLSGAIRQTVSDPSGHFRLAAIPARSYEVTIKSPGFVPNTVQCTLQPRDRAELNLAMSVVNAQETVEVMAAAPMVALDARRMDMALNLAPQMEMKALPLAARGAVDLSLNDKPLGGLEKTAEGQPDTHVRSYFPEALYINPEIITDRNGRAEISVPLADNITTWRMAMLASSAHGALGTGTSSLKVFQDFFVDLDLPVTLTQGDQISLPVAIYNYAGAAGKVDLQLEPSDWYALTDDDAEKTVTVEPDRVGSSQFSIAAKRIGKFKLTLKAQMNGSSKRADIVVREIEVVPNGREQTKVFNGTLENEIHQQIAFPAASIPDASSILVRLYPGPLSQVIEGMDSLLQMPSGCFEQTSSSTYPNVLALDYMKRTKKLTPEVHAKAEGFISHGYQRLLTFEVPGGGFSWFGNAPANKILTAYGLMEFSDMSKVHDVDPRLIERTQQWLAAQQQPDGSWKPDREFINEGATNRYNSDLVRITAYLAWSLKNTGYQGPAIEKAKQFVDAKLAKADPYTLAVVANFAVDYQQDRAFIHRAIEALLDARTEKDDKVWWSSAETGVYATGDSAAIETTGLAVQALLKSGENPAVSRKALTYIPSMKNAAGGWGTTQATIMALRAMLLASEKGGATATGTLEVLLNGRQAASVTLNSDNNDLLHQFVLKNVDATAPNTVDIRFSGKGSMAYQVAGRYFLPWEAKPEKEPLSIQVSYDRTRLAQDDVVTATASVRNNLQKRANMIMVDLGIPPGFELLSEDLEDFRTKNAHRAAGGRLEKFSLTATQAILYFDSIGAHDELAIKFRLRAKYPIRARTFASRVYEYYDPGVQSVAAPAQLEVRKR